MHKLLYALILLPLIAAADPGADLARDVLANGKLCSFGKGPTDRQECYVRAAPSRCEKEARSGVMGNAMLFQQFRSCIMSCGNAGAWSSTVGECRRSLVADDARKRVAMLNALGCFTDTARSGIGILREECASIVDDD